MSRNMVRITIGLDDLPESRRKGGRTTATGRMRYSEVIWHGTQAGSVYLKERKLKVSKPRLQRPGDDHGWRLGRRSDTFRHYGHTGLWQSPPVGADLPL